MRPVFSVGWTASPSAQNLTLGAKLNVVENDNW
jgi:hypothetical protein